MKVFASIITYNPDICILEKNLNAIYPQVEKVIVIDNASTNFDDIIIITKKYERIILLQNKKNRGIAAALNSAVKCCCDNNVDWLLTLDQDSIVPLDIINKYKPYTRLKRVGQLSCRFIDQTHPNFSEARMDPLFRGDSNSMYSEMDACITSACLMNTKICKKIGMFNEKLFIDDVDLDYSFRLKENKYKIYRINNIVIQHHLGNPVEKKFLFIKYSDYQYSHKRLYFQSRNAIYMMKKYKEHRFYFLLNVLLLNICKLLLNRDLKSIKAVLKGIEAGVKM